MKIRGRFICISAWSVAALTQAAFVLSTPDRIVVSGLDITNVHNLSSRNQLIFIALGLALAAISYSIRKWSPYFVLASSALYLLHWFPLDAVQKFGIVPVFKAKFLLGVHGVYWWTFVVRDIVLPVLFVISISLVALQWRHVDSQSPTA